MKKIVSTIASKFPGLANMVRRVYYYWLPEIQLDLESSLTQYIENKSILDKQGFYFIQIGAHNGSYDDPIVKIRTQGNWHGILLEPQKVVFQELKEKMKEQVKIKLLNVALGEEDGKRTMYKIAFSDKDWATGLTSFDLESLQRSINNGFVQRMALSTGDILPASKDDYIGEEEVSTISYKTLIGEFEHSPDMILVDTEGYDYHIVNRLLDNRVDPTIWWFEYSYMSIQQLEKMIKRLKKLGYRIKRSQWDIFAFK